MVHPADIPPIRDMKLMTATSGWVLAGQKVFWTATAGRTWTVSTPPRLGSEAIDGVYFADREHGWAVLHSPGARETGPLISVAFTGDGGKRWSAAPLPTDEYLLQGVGSVSHFSFADSAHGWLICEKASSSAASRASLFRTANGGITWTALPRPAVFGEITFVSESVGWLVGGVNDDEIFKTSDGGHAWVQKHIPLPRSLRPYDIREGSGLNYSGHVQYVGPHFKNQSQGLIEVLVPVKQVGDLRQLLYRTSDGGETWTLQTSADHEYGGTAAFFDFSVLGIACSGGKLSIAGLLRPRTLTLTYEVPECPVIRKADFLDSQHGWLLGNGGELLVLDGDVTVLIPPRGFRR